MAKTQPHLIRWLTPIEAEMWPDDRQYPAMRRGWVDVTTTVAADGRWTLLPHAGIRASRCRKSPRHPCTRPPVVILWRTHRHRPPRLVPWAYCEEHMFGRIIEDGRVLAGWLLNPAEFPEVP